MEERINVQEKGSNALKAVYGIINYLSKSSLDKNLMELICFRVSQINRCAYCLDMHSKELRAKGESEQRLYTLNAWQETPFFTERERAALAWAEAVTKCNVTDAIYKELIGQFSDEELIDLTLVITTINTYNRINLSFPAITGSYQVAQ